MSFLLCLLARLTVRSLPPSQGVAHPAYGRPSLHIHRVTDEAFYVLEGTFGFRVGEETVEGSAGAFVFAPKGIVHAFWNQGPSPARMLLMMSPPGFVRYLEELAEGLATVSRCTRPHWRDHIRRRRGSTMNKRSQEYIAASTLMNEMAMEIKNTTGTANPWMRPCLMAPSSRVGSVR